MAYSATSSDDSLFKYKVTPAGPGAIRMSFPSAVESYALDTGELRDVMVYCGTGKKMFPCPLGVNWCMFTSEMKR